MAGVLIGLDWGTTAFRAALMDGCGAILDRIATGDGLLSVAGGDFEAVLDRTLRRWEGAGRLPIVASGMVTSRTGWVETPYLPCPAGPGELARALVRRATPAGRAVAFVAGLSHRHGDGAPDVMRGEETQVAGLDVQGDRLAVLPGTHSKWVVVAHGRIAAFRTAMTGDVFAAVKDHTVLRLTAAAAAAAASDKAFAAGVAAGAAEGGAGLLGKLFRLRAGSLLGDFPAEETAERLSGLLIGTEIAEARGFAPGLAGPVLVVGGEALAGRYAAAFAALGLAAETAPADAAFRGQFRIARAAGLV